VAVALVMPEASMHTQRQRSMNGKSRGFSNPKQSRARMLTFDAAGHLAFCDLAAGGVRVVRRAEGGRGCSGAEGHDGEVNGCLELHGRCRRVKGRLRVEFGEGLGGFTKPRALPSF
jgi:hypothetical protein